jgi:hypothetical protein
MLCAMYVVTVNALGVLTSETKSTVDMYTCIYSPVRALTIIQ